MKDELEMPVAGQMCNVVREPGDQVVHRDHVVAVAQQPIAEMRADKARATSY